MSTDNCICMALDQLIEKLKSCVELEDMGALLSRVSVDIGSCAPFITFDPSHYTRHVAYRDHHLEVVIVCWDPGQVSGVHDHGGAMGWTVMLQGTLASWSYDTIGTSDSVPEGAVATWALADGRRLVEYAPTSCAAGQTAEFDAPNAVHRVGNVDPRGERAISLNVYSPPISRYTMFDLDAGTMHRCTPDRS